MSEETQLAAKAAKHGDKMIEVRIRFWTDGISDQKDTIIPKHAWDNGVVVMDSNKSHGIAPNAPKPFGSILELQAVLAKVLAEHGVRLHANRKLQKVLTS